MRSEAALHNQEAPRCTNQGLAAEELAPRMNSWFHGSLSAIAAPPFAEVADQRPRGFSDGDVAPALMTSLTSGC